MAACDFCNKKANEREALIFIRYGGKVCSECVKVCEDIIEDRFEARQEDDDRFEARQFEDEVDAPSDATSFLKTLPERSLASIDWCFRRIDRALNPPKREVLVCSFCGGQEGRLIAGPRVFICSACVGLCRRILAGDHARLLELVVPERVQVSVEPPKKPDAWAELPREQLSLIDDALRQEIERRQRVLLAAMGAIAGCQPARRTVEEEPETGAIPWPVLATGVWVNFPVCATGRWDINVSGGTAELRRRLARRLHQLSGRTGPFVRIDCRIHGALAEMMRAEGGMLFLDHVEALTPDAVELLDLSVSSSHRLLKARVVTSAQIGMFEQMSLDRGAIQHWTVPSGMALPLADNPALS
jgi:hypothetical protein